MSILFAALCALSYGAADYAGGRATRSLDVRAVLLLSQSVGFVGISLVALALGQPLPAPVDAAWGAAAGLSGVLGLGMLYYGLSIGAAAVVSPTAALVGTGAPIIAGLLLGELPTLTAWLGIALSIPAILLLSLSRLGAWKLDRRSLLFGAVAGIGFGGFFILIDRLGEGSGFWPLAASRIASLAAVSLLLALRLRSWSGGGSPTTPDELERAPGKLGRARAVAAVAGILDVAANAFFLLATRVGLLITSAVVSSLYPAPTVLLARTIDRERLGVRRVVGLLLALAGVSLMAI
jgi:drug/metabolite transporter (DMT)-like permease